MWAWVDVHKRIKSYLSSPVSRATDNDVTFAVNAVHLMVMAIIFHRIITSSVVNNNLPITVNSQKTHKVYKEAILQTRKTMIKQQ